jgi:hypothetical protein
VKPKWRVELGYRTKRGGVALGMTIDADNADDAEEIAKAKHIAPYRARKWVYTILDDVPVTHARRSPHLPPWRRNDGRRQNHLLGRLSHDPNRHVARSLVAQRVGPDVVDGGNHRAAEEEVSSLGFNHPSGNKEDR